MAAAATLAAESAADSFFPRGFGAMGGTAEGMLSFDVTPPVAAADAALAREAGAVPLPPLRAQPAQVH